ncbi:MAG: DUF547 domain-containing protein [Planctomycetota bacterium]|jgi:hypothetical protein
MLNASLLTFATLIGLAAGPDAPFGAPAAEIAAAASNAPAQDEPDAQEAPSQAEPAFDHGAWSEILEARVQGDRFDYAGLKRNRSGLDAYLAQLEAVSPEELRTWSKDEQKAYFINAYNAYVVSLVVENYPLKSINDLSTKKVEVWNKPFIPLGPHFKSGRDNLSLNELEHELLRKRYPDARIHVAVNCASEGCPPLRAAAFTGQDLDEQLDEQARRFVADSARMKLDQRKKRLEVSKIFEWFAEDFERDAGSVQAWIQRYAPGEASERQWIAKAKLKYREYSWKLNVLKR